ncbi:MAG: PLP-dependent transferase [Armatimonadetes bacterium]|nr:PLP-dependent transferase [Armatimonadota bacterium]
MDIQTLAVHAGHQSESAEDLIHPVSPAIILSSTFQRNPDGSCPGGYLYSQINNPNRSALESAIAKLEGARDAVAFASGSAAMMAVLQSLKPGDHVLAPLAMYYGSRTMLGGIFRQWGLQTTFAPMDDLEQVSAAITPATRLVITETPSNPTLRITDLRRVAQLAHAAGALVLCDNTWSTPILQRPIEFGVDLVLHSTTKYLGGHSDVTGGCIVAAEGCPLTESIRHCQVVGGAVPSPFDCWLLMRSIPTLPLRVRAQSAGAAAVAGFLQAHPRVATVHYPGLPDHPGHRVAASQMELFGGMLSFEIAGHRAEAMAVAARAKLFTRATSLGGVESLIEHRASVEPPGSGTPESLLRLSIGLEHPDDLIADLEQALSGLP